MDQIPLYVPLIFTGCVAATFGFLYYAVRRAKGSYHALMMGLSMLLWLLIVFLLAFNEFFMDFESRPPRLMLVVAFPLLMILAMLMLKRTREAIHQMPLSTLTYIHIIRIPIEVILWWLYKEQVVAEAMTFEGYNFDILSGLTAVFVALFLVGKNLRPVGAIIWNFLALGLLLNIVIRAVQYTPYYYDPTSGDLVNLAVFHFPYIWLPTAIVPAVLFAHLASLSKLFAGKRN